MFKYFFIISITINFLFANTSQLLIKNNLDAYENFNISVFKDSSNSLNIEQISKLTTFNKHSNKFSFGYIKDSLWIKLDLKNVSDKENLILSINEHFYEKANMYYFNLIENKWEIVKNGMFTPLKQRDIQTSKLAFNLNIPKDTSQIVYLQLEGKYSYFANIAIYTKDYFFTNQLLSMDSFFIFQFGVLIIIILFNLFLWLSLREKLFIYYVGYTFFALIYLINVSGLLAYFDLQYYVYKLHFSVAITIIFLSLFSIEYFEAKKHIKYSVYILKTLIIILFTFATMMLFSYTPWNNFMNHVITLILITLISTSIIIYFKGQRFIKYYIFAILIYFISVIVYILFIVGIFEYTYFNRYLYLFSLFIEIIVFAIMIANRYNIIKNEQLSIQEELISLQNNQNKILSEEVEKKTKKLKKLIFERELLVKEVFHRVKNNFHMVSAFLWFESKKDGNKNRFTELINRIKSMSIIHEYLCNSQNLIDINAKDYIDNLTKTIFQTYNIPNLKINTSIEDIDIGFEDIMSLGVIINEVISNSIKHHPKDKIIILDISCFKKDEYIILSIVDNGFGFNIEKQKTGFGLEIIKDFINKLPNGSYSFYQEKGTTFKLIFRDEKKDED